PHLIANALKTEHRIVNEEWNHVQAVTSVSGACGREGRHGTGFIYSLLQNLTVLGFVVIECRFAINRLVKLALRGIDSNLAEEAVHPEGARFVRNNRHDAIADFLVAQ